jgi:two-component system, NarL family, sensor kinase
MHSLSEETSLLVIATFFIIVIVIGIIVVVVIYQSKQRLLLLEQENQKTLFQQTLLQTQIEIQEQTLTNISQELHDNIGQSLSLAKLNLNTLKLHDATKAQESIDITKLLISQSLVNIRNLAKSMLGEKITEIGLQQAVQNELKILEHTGQYEISFTANENTNVLTPQQELLAFRILQEALQNILKHAEASKIDVEFNYTPSQTNITITDNGKGFNISALDANATGIGLKNMKSRAALINAELKIESTVFQGTSFCLKISTK